MWVLTVLRLSLLTCLGAAALGAGWLLLPDDSPADLIVRLGRARTRSQAEAVLGRPADVEGDSDALAHRIRGDFLVRPARVLRWEGPGYAVHLGLDPHGDVFAVMAELHPAPTSAEYLAHWLGW